MTNEYKYVPVEPTDEMFVNGGENFFDAARSWKRGSTINDQNKAAMIYKAMLAAAPEQPYPVEPDFYLWGDEVVWRYSPEINQCIREQGTPLFAHPPKVPVELLDREAIRNAALEEAAKECYRHAESLKKTFSDTEQWALVRGAVMASGEMIRALKSQPAQPSDSQAEFSDTEMLDWLGYNRACLGREGIRYFVTIPDDEGYYNRIGNKHTKLREAIKAAMRTEREDK